MSELKTTCETTQAVAAEDTGRWLVTTEPRGIRALTRPCLPPLADI